ncbi:MAG: preprotein translocase subunit SecE [bacterium]|jgi:preprotein translocase subunit SecE
MSSENLTEGSSRLDRVKTYFRELGFEWKKITFPEHKPLPFAKGWSRAELWRATITVFVFTTIFALLLSLMDIVITQVFNIFF